MGVWYSMAFSGIKGYLLVRIMHTSSYDNYPSELFVNDPAGVYSALHLLYRIHVSSTEDLEIYKPHYSPDDPQ